MAWDQSDGTGAVGGVPWVGRRVARLWLAVGFGSAAEPRAAGSYRGFNQGVSSLDAHMKQRGFMGIVY